MHLDIKNDWFPIFRYLFSHEQYIVCHFVQNCPFSDSKQKSYSNNKILAMDYV